MSALELDEQVARIERMQEETRKFATEQRKISAEIQIMPWQFVITAMGTGAAIFAAGAAFLKLLGA
jgi:hypothetical protein